MKSRRLLFYTVSFISVFLFISGTFLLSFYDASSSTFAFYEVNTDKPISTPDNNTEPDTKPIDDKPFNVVLLVGDKWECNTDTILVANYYPDKKQLNLISIPRDTKVDVESMTIPKINALYAMTNGTELLIQSLSDILDIQIDNYIYLGMDTFREIIDILGGVDINIPVDLKYEDPTQDLYINFRKGLQHLDGKQAEYYLRFRMPNNGEYTQELLKYYDGSDLKRIEVQKNFIKELIRQKSNFFYLTKLNEIINSVYDNLNTNISSGDVLKLVQYAVYFKTDNLKISMLPGEVQKNNGYDFYIHDKEKIKEMFSQFNLE